MPSAASEVCCDGRGWTLTDGYVSVCPCGVYDPPKWVERGDPACVIAHTRDPERPRRAAHGRLCAGCYAHLERTIAELPYLHAGLARMMAPRRGVGGRVSGTPEDRLPILVTDHAVVGPAADHREQIARVLASWVRLVYEERNEADHAIHEARLAVWKDAYLANTTDLPRPVWTPWRRPSGVRPDQTAPWLLAHLGWAAGAVWVDDLAGEVHGLRRRATALLYPSGRRRIEVGPCGDCPGVLWLTGDVDEARTMACDGCGRVVEPRYWRRERKRIDGVDVNPWLPLDVAAAQYGISVRTLQRWIAKGKLKARCEPTRVRPSAVEGLLRGLSASA